MINFKYHAVDANGKNVTGTIQALDEFDAVTRIRASYPVIIDVKSIGNKEAGVLSLELGSQKIKEKDLAVMCSQFSIMLRSGIPLPKAVGMIARQTKDKKLKRSLESAAEDVEQGSTLAAALDRTDTKFPITFIETIKAGEQSGTVDQTFQRMQTYYEKSYKNKAKIRQAMIYPIFVVIVAIVVLFVVMLKVIPVLSETFTSLGGDLPLMTRMMIGMSNFFASYWGVMIFVIVALVLFVSIFKKTDRGSLIWGKLMLKLPVFGKINMYNCAAQFADTMSILISSGFSVNKSMEVTARVIDNDLLAHECDMMVPKIEEGKTLGTCMTESDQFPDNLVEMCTIGEDSGELDETLITIGDYYHNESDNATAKMLAMLEPVMLICLAVFAGFIVISIYLPMFTMYNYM